MIRKSITGWLWLMGLLLVTGSPANGQFKVALTPYVVEAEIRPGGRGILPFQLSNQDPNESVTIRIFASEIRQGERGEYTLSDTLMRYSCVSWLSLPDTLIEIGPGETRAIPVEVKAPFNARGGAYGAVVFEMLTDESIVPRDEMGVFGTLYRYQIPGWIEIKVKSGRAARGRLEPGAIAVTLTADDPRLAEKFGDRGIVVSTAVENIGNVHVRAKGRFIIRDMNGRLVKDAQLGSGRGAILPGARTRLRTITKLPPPGQYTVKTFINYGGASPAISKSTFEISKQQTSRIGETETTRPLYVQLRPDRYETSIPAGGFRTFGINVMNREEIPLSVEVSMGQIRFDPWGHMWVTEEEADTGRSCVSWISVEPPQFTIDPYRAQNIRLTLAIDAEAKGGYYACVILNARSDVDTSTGTLPTPLYLPIYLTVPPEIEKGGDIVKIEVEQPRKSTIKINTEFLNSGNIHALISGAAQLQFWKEPQKSASLEILDTARFEDLVSIELAADTTFVLPGQTRLISSQTLDGLVSGRYKVKVEIRFGTKEPATMEKEFVVTARDTEE